MTTLLAKDETREIRFSGPIRTGLLINSPYLLVHGYKKYQEEICSELNTIFPGVFSVPSLTEDHSEGDSFDTLNEKHSKTLIPPYFLDRTLTGNELLKVLEERGLSVYLECPVEREGDDIPAVFHVSKLNIEMYDFGYGSLLLEGYIVAKQELDVMAFREAVEKISTRLPNYNAVIHDTFTTIERFLPPQILMADAAEDLALQTSKDALKIRPRSGKNYLLWAHRIFPIRCQNMAEYEVLREASKPIVYTGDEEMIDSSLVKGVSIYPGHENSLVVFDGETAMEKDVTAMEKVIRAQNVFMARAEEYDFALFYFINDLTVLRNEHSLAKLEGRLDHIIEFQAQISFFRGVFDDYDNHLEQQALLTWKDVLLIWDTMDRFEGIESKSRALEEVYDQVYNDLQTFQNKKLNAFVMVLILISLVSMMIHLVDLTRSGDLGSNLVVKLTGILIMASLLMFVGGRLLRRS